MSNIKEASSASFSTTGASAALPLAANLALLVLVLRDERTMLDGPAAGNPARFVDLLPVAAEGAEVVLGCAVARPALVSEVGLRGADVPRLVGEDGAPVDGPAVRPPVAMVTPRGAAATGCGRSAHSAANAAAALSFQEARGV